jgi:hypothetical protein
MVEWLMNDELESMWKEAAWPALRYYPKIWLTGLRKSTEYLSEGSLCPTEHSDWIELEALPLEWIYLVHTHTKLKKKN